MLNEPLSLRQTLQKTTERLRVSLSHSTPHSMGQHSDGMICHLPNCCSANRNIRFNRIDLNRMYAECCSVQMVPLSTKNHLKIFDINYKMECQKSETHNNDSGETRPWDRQRRRRWGGQQKREDERKKSLSNQFNSDRFGCVHKIRWFHITTATVRHTEVWLDGWMHGWMWASE